MSSSNAHKPQLLMLVSRFPFPLEKGDKLRAFHQLHYLSEHYDVTLVAISDQDVTESQVEAVRPFCSSLEIMKINSFTKGLHLFGTFFHKRPFQTSYFYSWRTARKIRKLITANDFAHIYCQLIRTTEYVKNEHRISKTLDYMDALSAGIQRRIEHQPFYKKWLFRSEAKRLAAYERSIFDYFEHLTIISEQDRLLIQHPEHERIHIIPNGIHAQFFERIEVEVDHDFVFVGNMSYAPNVDAVHYIAQHILPAFPEKRLLISGSSPDVSVRQLAAKNQAVTLTGWVEDIRTSYCRGKIFLAPMSIGTGMQNKLLEAMALGIPCITSPLANNAIKAVDNEHIVVASGVDQFIAAIQHVSEHPEFANQLSKAGSEFIRTHYSWQKSVDELVQLMQSK